MLSNKNVFDTSAYVLIPSRYIRREDIDKAEQCLVDNGIDEDEACTILQALGYILLDEELYPEPV